MSIKVEAEKQVTVTIQLTEKSAQWLRAYVQNCPYDAEESEDEKHRHELFHGLNNALGPM